MTCQCRPEGPGKAGVGQILEILAYTGRVHRGGKED